MARLDFFDDILFARQPQTTGPSASSRKRRRPNTNVRSRFIDDEAGVDGDDDSEDEEEDYDDYEEEDDDNDPSSNSSSPNKRARLDDTSVNNGPNVVHGLDTIPPVVTDLPLPPPPPTVSDPGPNIQPPRLISDFFPPVPGSGQAQSRVVDCLICRYGSVKYDERGYGMGLWKEAIEIINEELVLMDPTVVTQNFICRFNENVVPHLTPYVLPGETLPIPQYAPILEHLTTNKHSLSPKLMLLINMRRTDKVMQKLYHESLNTEDLELMIKASEALRKWITTQTKLHKENPERFTYAAESVSDIAPSGPIGLAPPAYYERQRRRGQQTSAAAEASRPEAPPEPESTDDI